MDTKEQTGDGKLSFTDEPTDEENDYDESKFIQVQNRFIVCNVKKGLMVVDQNLAHFRIKYEDILGRLKSSTQHSQQQLFPQNINLTKNDGEILKSLFEELKNIGFEIEDAGKGNFVIVGVPADLKDTNIPSVIESIIENHKSNVDELDFDKNINIAKSIAIRSAIKNGIKLDKREMKEIFDSLFKCKAPTVSPDGKNILRTIGESELEQILKNPRD
jgi:DNA mismatch repair protein MutL